MISRSLVLAQCIALIVPWGALAAQSGPVELEGSVAHTRLDWGTYSAAATSVWGGTAAVRWWVSPKVALTGGAAYAPGSDDSKLAPGLTTLSVGGRYRPVRGSRWAVTVGAAGGPAHFAADTYAERLASCTPEAGCLWEGTIYRTGWRWVVQGDLAVEGRLLGRLGVIAGPMVHALVGSGQAGPGGPWVYLAARAGLLLRL